jgi:aminoglycoside 6-adenylyltransferase
MRSAETIYQLILDCARKDPRVRLVLLSGSRANPDAPRDDLQDFDVAWFVTNLDSFRGSEAWLESFGSRLMMQKPAEMGENPPKKPDLVYLMLFEDGNRIDLSLRPLESLEAYASGEGLWSVLLDKDQRASGLPNPSAARFAIEPPSAKAFADCCNEFWWVSPYVAKGLCRREQLYAVWHMEAVIRQELLRILGWLVGVRDGFPVCLGKHNKYLQARLEPSEWKLLMRTCRMSAPRSCWQALFAAQKLFRRASLEVSTHFGYPYPSYERAMSQYIQKLFRNCLETKPRPDEPADV